MARDLVTVPPDITLEQLAEEHFLREGRPLYPVVENGRVLGVVGISDLSKVDRESFGRILVGAVMTPVEQLRTLTPETPLLDAVVEMGPQPPNRRLVLRDGRLLGELGGDELARLIRIREALARS
jgi:CBS domain-containing protein